MGQEEMPAMRRDILDEVDAVKKANGVHPYDPQRPWALVWTRATEHIADKFGSDEFEKPATSVRLEFNALAKSLTATPRFSLQVRVSLVVGRRPWSLGLLRVFLTRRLREAPRGIRKT